MTKNHFSLFQTKTSPHSAKIPDILRKFNNHISKFPNINFYLISRWISELQPFLPKKLPNSPTPSVSLSFSFKSHSLEKSTAIDKSCLGKAGMALVGGYGNQVFSYKSLRWIGIGLFMGLFMNSVEMRDFDPTKSQKHSTRSLIRVKIYVKKFLFNENSDGCQENYRYG